MLENKFGNEALRHYRGAWRKSSLYRSVVLSLFVSLLMPAFGNADVLAASVFYDFQNGSSAGWTTYGGTWSVVNGEYTVNSGQGFKSVISGSNYNSFIYEADVNVAAGGNAGFIIRAGSLGVGVDAYTGYYIGLNTAGNSVQMGKVNNNWTQMINYPFTVTPNTWYHLKVIASGGSMDTYVGTTHVLSTFEKTFPSGAVGLRVFNTSAKFDNVRVTDNGVINSPTYNWSGKKGAIYVPSNAVNMIDFWQTYDSALVDRELSYAQTYGMNSLAIYLPYKMWVNNPTNLLNNFENFLTVANNRGLKVSPIFFDNCWNGTVNLGAQGAPIPGVHNSRWVQSPGDDIKTNYYASYKTSIRNYVQAFVNAHLNDSRILFWEQMNEPGCSGFMNEVTIALMNDARIAIKETGSTIPVNSCACQLYEGAYFSDYFSYHDYDAAYNAGPKGSQYFMTEGMNRGSQSVPGMVAAYGPTGTGYMFWELMIGRTNTRFPWGSPQNAPEPTVPFHGIIYPDGHPWSVNDVVALNGSTTNMAVYAVDYYNGVFATQKKSSVTPLIDFDLNTEKGTASPDASAGVAETNYSVRWNGTLRPATTGVFTFYADSDNKARIWVNGVQVVNKTTVGRSEVSGTISLNANQNYPVKVEYEHGTGVSNMHVRWSGPSLSKQALRPVKPNSVPTTLTINQLKSFQVTTPGFTDRYLAHAAGLGVTVVVNSGSPTALKQDATWWVRSGLASSSCYSFESRNFPGQYLRHSNYRLRREAGSGALFNADATFCARPGNSGTGVSFESYNFPGYFIRHFNSEVYIAVSGGPNTWDNAVSFTNDTTWAVVAPWGP